MNVERLIRDLDGKEPTSGKLALAMAATADKMDWKLVARKDCERYVNCDY